MKKRFKRMLASALCVATVLSNCMISYAEPEAKATENNLALNKSVSSSAEYPTMPASKAVDGIVNDVRGDRWSSEAAPAQWIQVDLGETSQFEEFRIVAQGAGDGYDNRLGQFKIEGSDAQNGPYDVIYQSEDKTADGFPQDYVVTLEQAVTYRYVKLTIQKLCEGAYPNVSLREFEVRAKSETDTQDPQENVALGKTAASTGSVEFGQAANVVDGNTTAKTSRWAANSKPASVYVDLGEELNVRTVKLFWERRNAKNYEIQIANENPETEASWTTVKAFTEIPAVTEQFIVLDNTEKARYVRLKINDYQNLDLDEIVNWNSVSIYEMEVYGGELKAPEVPWRDQIVITEPAEGATELEYTLPTIEGYTVTYNGTDYEQVIGSDGRIYQPVVDTTVKVSFKKTNNEDKTDYEFVEKTVTVPGQYTVEANDNAAPAVLPELREWKGTSGTFTPTEASRIVIADESLLDMAKKFKADYEEITKNTIEITDGTANAGDFYFALTTDTSKGLQDEGYLMTIADKVSVEAETATGAYWATRTILQSLKQTDNIPCGIARDYPLYKVRGFILDVGRKTFTMDYLKQIVKQMSWYKMNDFQVHLNDNLIFLEAYPGIGKDPMTAYSGFRLESDIKEGGNNGLNKADLTNKDVFYKKDEFRSFIKDSRVMGVNIVPEIDTPAHSLALTKVRPDLRHGTNGRNNDHLNLTSKYDDSLAFVQSIFDEYMGADVQNPVFDKDTIVHIGADEYSADGNAFRRFCNDMLAYVKDSGRQPRIWGSLTEIKGDGSVPVDGTGAQMNLWNFGWANMDKMYEKGFDLINCNDGNFYIVPNAGYYHPSGISNKEYYNANLNSIGGVTIPAGDKQMAGAAFAVWNDMIDIYDNGVSEYDIYDLANNGFSLMGANLWGRGSKDVNAANDLRNELGDAPNTNFGYKVKDENGVIKQDTLDTVENAVKAVVETVDGKEALRLNGGESYVTTGLKTVGLGNDLRVKVKRTSNNANEQILFESSYGAIKAVQKDTGKVGFSREGFDYSFDYTLPVDEWVELEFKNELHVVALYVNGKLIDTLGDDEIIPGNSGQANKMRATMMIPFEKIGASANAFEGYVDDVRLGVAAEYNSTMKLDYAAITANTLAAENAELAALVEEAKAIFAEFAPTAEEITNLTDRINAALEAAEFEKADYSRVESYKAVIPTDLSVFTEESVVRLNQVLASIRYDLPASMQSTVDGYEAVLANAVNGLEMRKEANVNYVDSNTLTARADSVHSGEGADKAIDGNLNTMWHCDWNNTTMPHWIDLKMQTPTALNGLTYVPRQSGGSNGILTKYEIQISNDGTNYTKHAEGTLANNTSTKVINFEEVTTTYVRLVFVEAVGNFGSAAEIKLHLANVAADLEGLNLVIADADKIVTTMADKGYTVESWKALTDKLAEAKALAELENPDPNDVEVMKRELSAVMSSLVLDEKAGIYTVSVNGRVIRKAEYNTKVVITAPEPVYGEQFVGWKVNGGEAIISKDPTYMFYIANDVSFEACYAPKEEVIEQNPEALLSNVLITSATATKSNVKFVGQLVIPKGYTLLKAGLVWSTKENTELVVKEDGTGLKPTFITKISDTNQFSVTIKGMPNSLSLRGKIFAKVRNNETNEEYYIYSDEGVGAPGAK